MVTTSQVGARPYHHGNLRPAMIDAAVTAIGETGAASISLRELARRVGVTHGAAAHHFGDKTGLLTAVATDGYRHMADELEATAARGDFADVGVSYVRFASTHPAHFEVMFRPELLNRQDQELRRQQARAAAVLHRSAVAVTEVTGGDAERAAVAAWALVHGIATLWLDGNLPRRFGDPVALAADVTPYLFQASTASRRRTRR